MSDRWRNRILYWMLIAIIPVTIGYILKQYYPGPWLSVFILFYIFLYRPLINIARLHNLKVIDQKEMWKLFIPLYETRYRDILWVG